MSYKYGVSHVICILFIIGSALGYDLLVKGKLSGTEQEKPFGRCKIYPLDGSKLNATDDQPLQDGSELGFYPLTDDEVILSFEIYIGDVVFRVTIEGSMFKLEKCSKIKRYCTVEDHSGLKHPDFMRHNEWNIVRVSLNARQLAIYVGSSIVKTMSMVDYPTNDMSWIVKYKSQQESTKTKTAVKSTGQYLVQFNCKDFVPKDVREPTTKEPWGFPSHDPYPKPTFKPDVNPYRTTPRQPKKHTYDDYTKFPPHHNNPTTNNYYSNAAPHVDIKGTPHGGMSKASYIGLIVGLVVGTLALILVALLVFYLYKKRSTLAITDQTPLQDQKTTK